jgi:restriction endonuclease Mrr
MLTFLDHAGTPSNDQTLMLPILQLASDGQEHRISDVIEPLGKKFGVTPDEFEEMLPSGRQPIFYNRVHWAKTYLAQAKLLEITRRAYFRITDRGEISSTKTQKELMFGCWSSSRSSTNSRSALAHLRLALAFPLRRSR